MSNHTPRAVRVAALLLPALLPISLLAEPGPTTVLRLTDPSTTASDAVLAGADESTAAPAQFSSLYACARFPANGSMRLFNPDVTIVATYAQFLDDAGRVVGSKSVSLLPGQQVEVRPLFVESSGTSWVKVSATGRLNGQCTVPDRLGRSAVLALHEVADGSGLVAPRMLPPLRSPAQPLEGELSVANAGPDTTTVRLIPHGANGEDLTLLSREFEITPVTLAAGARFTKKLPARLEASGRAVAWVEIESPGPIAGALEFLQQVGEPGALPTPGPNADALETGLFFDLGNDLARSFTLVNPSATALDVDVEVFDGTGVSLARQSFAVPESGTLHGWIDEQGMQVRGGTSAPGLVTGGGIELPGSDAARVQTVRLRSSSGFVAAQWNQGTRGALEAFVPSGASDHLSFAPPPAAAGQYLLLQADRAGQAVVRIHDASGRETFSEALQFDGPATRKLLLTRPTTEPSSAGVVTVVGEPSGIALTAVVEMTTAARSIAVLTPASGPPSETLPSGDDLNRPPDTHAVPLRPVWDDWVRSNHDVIASLDSNNFEDLQFFKERIGERRIVQLGESSHGTAEFSSIKVRLIKFLHQQMGFDVIAFESGLFECEWTQSQDPSTFNKWQHLYGSIFSVWHSYEALELFDYIRQSKRTPRPLLITGFDPQRSSYTGGRHQPQFLRDVFEPLDPEFAEELFLADTEYFENNWNPDYIEDNGERLITIYQQALSLINGDVPVPVGAPIPPRTRMLTVRVLENNLKRIELHYYYYVWGSTDLYINARDEAMAANIDWLADSFYPGKRIAVWAHDFHIRHDEPHVGDSFYYPTMGWHLVRSRRDELYTVGISMYRGWAAWNDRRLYRVKLPAFEASVEAIGYATERKLALIDILSSEPVSGNSWMRNWIYFWSWGYYGPVPMFVDDNYDALLFVDESHPPSYIY